jgi:hypothetical protein
MPVGTTDPAEAVNTCLPADERPNKTPIFISGVEDTRTFLAWLRFSCPTELTAQLKADELIVVLATANTFRAAVSALRSLEGKGWCVIPHLPSGGSQRTADDQKPREADA